MQLEGLARLYFSRFMRGRNLPRLAHYRIRTPDAEVWLLPARNATDAFVALKQFVQHNQWGLLTYGRDRRDLLEKAAWLSSEEVLEAMGWSQGTLYTEIKIRGFPPGVDAEEGVRKYWDASRIIAWAKQHEAWAFHGARA